MKIKYFTNIASHYRKPIWSKLIKSANFEIEFFFGKKEAAGIKEICFKQEPFLNDESKLKKIKNIWFQKRILVWQTGVIKRCLADSFDKAVFLGEANCISTWFATIICHFRNIEVIFWGHGLYGNESFFKLLFRKTFCRLADKHLVYERRAKQLMINEGFKKSDIYVIFNSLDYDRQKKLREKFEKINKREVFDNLEKPHLPVLIFIGRLTIVKKLDLLIKAINNINNEVIKVNLVLIGDGNERTKLEKLGEKGIKNKWINFIGACYDEQRIARFLSVADLCISPGSVGLTAIHSLTYGTPVGTHDDLSNQGPEVGAIEDGFNGFFFKKNCIKSLKKKIQEWFQQDVDDKEMRKRCFRIVDKFYNPDYQLTVFENMVKNKKPKF